MLWLNKHKRIWRIIILALFLIALIGPWVFEQIHVPAEYHCSPPNFRLEGDFCGTPLSGIWIFTAIIGNFFRAAARLFTGTLTLVNFSRELLFSVLYLFLVLPFLTTLLLILRKNQRFWFQRIRWSLAVGIALLYLVLSHFFMYPLKLWGLSLYIVVATAALILELIVFRSIKI
ncbi:hypothetical protein [Candidatus Leptofilum sp.]|uniref:hypothetical protein n=1 Tax=Candidatus Leptofilum sp. TaxID=3241576 RepID=UPI003B5A6B0E